MTGMSSETRHFKQEMQELLDDRLNYDARPEVQRHLESCQECKREFEALSWTKEISRQQFELKAMPAKLEESISKALDLEDCGSRVGLFSRPFRWPPRRALLTYGFILAAAVVLVLSYSILRKPGLPTETASLPLAVARDYRNYQTETLPLSLETGNEKELERFFLSAGIAFDTRVFDLGMMNYHLLGGRIHQLIGRQSALFVYRGKNRRVLICQMYPGHATELPPGGATLREEKGILFYIYRDDGLTIVFWQEGAVFCVLTSDGDPEEVVQLAVAKSVKV